MALHDLFKSGDWKQEKHVPVIEVSSPVKKSETVKVTVSVGREVAHPNTSEHHIGWIEVYFLAEQAKFPYQLGKFTLTAHGASTEGPNTSSIYASPEVVLNFKTEKSGTILASSYCNIHGLWEGSKTLTVE